MRPARRLASPRFLTSKQRFAHENDCVVDAGGGDRALPVRHPAKAGGQKFDNNDPRPWLARQEGWRARANAAQSNAFEALPFFYAAVLFALHNQADATRVATLMACWLGLRLGYLAMYVAGWGALRSLVWATSIGFTIAILFTGV